jgi:site-specific DNA-methyltransferase (adenine-specific)
MKLKGDIICGDANKVLDDLDFQYDLTVFSPPYDKIRTVEEMGRSDYLKHLGKRIYDNTVERGVCAVVIRDSHQGGQLTGSTRQMVNWWVDDIGWHQWADIIYHRHGRPGAWWNSRFRVDHEYIHLFVKQDARGTIKPRVFHKESTKVPAIHAGAKWHGTQTLSSGKRVKIPEKEQAALKCRGTVWHYNTSNTEGNKLKLQHPATMPDQMAEDLIKCFSDPGDLVLDPMCGSGTTCVMAMKNDRRSIGIEKDEKWAALASRRMVEGR